MTITNIDDDRATASGEPRGVPEAPAPLVLTGDEAAELLAFVRKATPLLDELAEHLPKLRPLAPMLAQVAQGGPAGLVGMLGAVLRGS
jgi:hypothetical protein